MHLWCSVPADMNMFNRPSVAGAVLQTPFLLIDSSFSSESSRQLHTQTIKARDLKFLHNIYHLLCVRCHMSGVRQTWKKRTHRSPLTPKTWELGSWDLERKFTSSHMSSAIWCENTTILFACGFHWTTHYMLWVPISNFS